MSIVELNSGQSFDAEANVVLLEAAAQEGLFIPYSCKTGRCQTCKCKVLSGETKVLKQETGLSEDEKQQGWILSCARSAVSDLVLQAENLLTTQLPDIQTLPCRISTLERIADDVIKVVLRLPPTANFDFIPGQYIDVIGRAGIRRSYSIANASRGNALLELHVRVVSGGVMSEYWFNQAKTNDLLRLNGPFGTFFLRDSAVYDVIFLATGTGIAPVKAILESIVDVPNDRRPKSIAVLWGGRSENELYFNVDQIPGEHLFIPVLSRGQPDWEGATGYVQHALLEKKPDLINSLVYACGSEMMISAAKKLLISEGLPSNQFYADAFVCTAIN